MRKTVSNAALIPPPSLGRVPVQSPYYNPSAALTRWQQGRNPVQNIVPRLDQTLKPGMPRERVPTQNPPYRPSVQTIMDAGTVHLDYADELRKRFPGS